MYTTLAASNLSDVFYMAKWGASSCIEFIYACPINKCAQMVSFNHWNNLCYHDHLCRKTFFMVLNYPPKPQQPSLSAKPDKEPEQPQKQRPRH